MIYVPKNHDLPVWVFYDLDQTVIKTYKDENGEPCYRNGKPLYTREVWAEVRYEAGMISKTEFSYLREPWLLVDLGEMTKEEAAQEVNRRDAEVMEGKSYSDAVHLVKTKLAPRVILKEFVEPIYVFFKRHTNPAFGPVTNVYDEVCQGYHDAGILEHQFRICNKRKVVDGRIDGYEVDVSQDKQAHVEKFLAEKNIPYEHTFGFIDKIPQDAWGALCCFLYGIGPDKDTKKFIEIYKGKMVREGKRGTRELIRNLNRAIRIIKGEVKVELA